VVEQQPTPQSGQFLIVVKQFDANSICNFLRHKIASTSGATTIEVFEKLSRFAHWEYAEVASPSQKSDVTSLSDVGKVGQIEARARGH
jgi:hypothetical protein